MCSGEYLAQFGMSKQQATDSGQYVIKEGLFLKVILYILYGIIGAACYSACFAAVFLSNKKTKAEIESGNMFKEKPEPQYEKQIRKNQAMKRAMSMEAQEKNQLLK